MPNPPRKVAFIISATDQGTLIVNRFDQHLVEQGGIGAGFQLLETASYDASEVDLMVKMLELRRQYYGDGVVAVDCGANIGVHTIEWAKRMTGWGVVLAFEAQERIYYALAGNIAINNCFNARAIHAAVTAGHDENADTKLSRTLEFWQSRTQETREHGVYRPSDRLFRKQDGRRANN